MSKKSSGPGWIGSIIFFIILYNIISGDDEDKTEIDVVDQDQFVVEETKTGIDKSLANIKEKTNNIIQAAKDEIEDSNISEDISDVVKTTKENISKKVKGPISKEGDDEEELEEKKSIEEVTPDKPLLKKLDDEKKETSSEMKRL